MYLFLDTETGGLDTQHSLLTLAAVIADKDFQPVRGGNKEDTLYLQIRHPEYLVTPGAMTINKIDLVHHSAIGVKIEEARVAFEEFIKKALTMTGCGKLMPVGHNLAFDLRFIWAQLMPRETWERYCGYHFLDTMTVARFFNAIGLLDSGCSLTDLRELFQIETGEAHNAMADTKATLAVARALAAVALHTSATT
jgi:DNA polymerase III epsilon subunit-like protein